VSATSEIPPLAVDGVVPARSASVTPTATAAASSPRPGALAADLRVALMRTVRRLRAEKSDEELSDSQYTVLAYLDRAGPSTPRSLAEYERVQPPSMTRTLAGLTEAGLVAREGHPADGRQVIVRLTPEGRATVRETRRRRDAWLARRLADLDPAERQVLSDAAQIMRRIADT
jgi:DNA-binding MarR family transcriptional regulator